MQPHRTPPAPADSRALPRPTEPPQPMPPAPAEGSALYVHLPFCVVKCPYCDFFSVEAEGQDHASMVQAILHEARARAPRNPDTVFLGGGTPSLLAIPLLRQLLDGLDQLTGFRESAREVTAECNPESLDEPKARALLDLGVRRLSIGFQSLDPATLQLFGRAHDPAQALRSYDDARSAGVQEINVDLIYAAPGQTPEAWESELETVLALGPEHLSAYNLTFEEGTRFHTWLRQGRMERAPEEVELRCFELTRELTAAAGLEAYEISNHAGPGRECRHNLTYWANAPYTGLGPGAVSKLGHGRYGNPRAVAPYLRRIAAAGHATEWHEELTPEGRLGESWWLGLRRSIGVEPAEARATAGFEGEVDPALEVAARLQRRGLLVQDRGRWSLSADGLPLADAVAREFLA